MQKTNHIPPFIIYQLSTGLTKRASTSILTNLCRFIPSGQPKDGLSVAPWLFSRAVHAAGGHSHNAISRAADVEPTCRNIPDSSRTCSTHFPPGRQELWRAYYISPPKSSLALYLAQEPAQGLVTVLQSSQTFSHELSFVPGTGIRLESLKVSGGGRKSLLLRFLSLLYHFQLLSRFFRSQGILRSLPDLFASQSCWVNSHFAYCCHITFFPQFICILKHQI